MDNEISEVICRQINNSIRIYLLMEQSCGMPMEIASVELCNELFLFLIQLFSKLCILRCQNDFFWLGKNMQTGENQSLDSWDRCFSTENKMNANGREVTRPKACKKTEVTLYGLQSDWGKTIFSIAPCDQDQSLQANWRIFSVSMQNTHGPCDRQPKLYINIQYFLFCSHLSAYVPYKCLVEPLRNLPISLKNRLILG